MVRDARVDTGTVSDFLDRLGAPTPTPASGSVAALCVAQAAALVAMVARLCDQAPVVDRSEELVVRARRLMVEDETAFAAVAAAWALPRGAAYDEERRTAVEQALLGAAEPQAQVVETANEVLGLVDRLRSAARPGVHADLLAAGEVARAGCSVARTNGETDVHGLPDSPSRSRLLRRLGVTEEGV